MSPEDRIQQLRDAYEQAYGKQFAQSVDIEHVRGKYRVSIPGSIGQRLTEDALIDLIAHMRDMASIEASISVERPGYSYPLLVEQHLHGKQAGDSVRIPVPVGIDRVTVRQLVRSTAAARGLTARIEAIQRETGKNGYIQVRLQQRSGHGGPHPNQSGRPPLPEGKRKRKISAAVDPTLAEWVEQQMPRLGEETLSATINRMLRMMQRGETIRSVS